MKDIIKLCQPSDATDDIEAHFWNQAIPLNEVVIANEEKDREIKVVCISIYKLHVLMPLYFSSQHRLKNAPKVVVLKTLHRPIGQKIWSKH